MNTTCNVYNTLNLWTGAVANETAVEFACADIKKDEKFPVAGYEYLAMNYLLVDSEKEVVDIEFTYSDDVDAKTRTVGSVPVQRNYRTNIYGQLLTSDVDINVEIKPEYKEPAYEADALYHAAAFGGEVTLTEDVVLETPLNVQTNMVINLNGKAITGNWHKNDGAVIKNNATLTIVGGTISSLANNGGSAILNNGVLQEVGKTDELFTSSSVAIKELTDEEEIVPDTGINIKLGFNNQSSNEPIITSMARELNIDFSIVGGKLEKFRDNVLGSLIIIFLNLLANALSLAIVL